ncbi:hypothetical protein K2173_024050 [Erythroxylum novogranatense]|uniref:Uncharacterized protein n=1 Tax=Erythroxylum novogranatense TaxID=1862640 RepID=A0AAV8TSL0_9ROSI|nr:hypothetical protein K2173_024050 [Erythroxylum novogranatense]
MKVQLLSKKFVKPSIPTPCHLRKLKISFIDQLAPAAYMPLIFYYSADDGNIIEEKCKQLENSLSETLAIYYPLAGRYVEDCQLVDCNDEGALFLEARVDKKLAQFMGQQEGEEMLNQLLPFPNEMDFSPVILAIKVNKFECGGLAIGINASHKVVDGASLSLFTNAWCAACRTGIDGAIPRPSFEAGSLFPARYGLRFATPVHTYDGKKIITRRFVFSGDAISTRKATTIKNSPSRVKVVTALIWKAFIESSRSKHGKLRPCLLTLSLNFRGKTLLPLTENSCGNLYMLVVARFEPNEQGNVELNGLVNLVDKSLKKATEECAEVASPGDMITMVSNGMEEVHEEVRKGDADVCIVSSMCKFPCYETDFGWGKPEGVSCAHRPLEMAFLMDAKSGDGIEALVTLEENNMLRFQKDKDILAFTSKFEPLGTTQNHEKTEANSLRFTTNSSRLNRSALVNQPISPKWLFKWVDERNTPESYQINSTLEEKATDETIHKYTCSCSRTYNNTVQNYRRKFLSSVLRVMRRGR